jgi:hypothetical protein
MRRTVTKGWVSRIPPILVVEEQTGPGIILGVREREDRVEQRCVPTASPIVERDHVAQLSTLSPGTADRSASVVTTLQLPRLRAIAAI